MCLVKKPKSVAVTQTEKEPAVLRNPFLDGIDPIIRAQSTGLKSLRVDAASTKGRVGNPALTISPTASPTATTSVTDEQRKVLGMVAGNKFAASL
ncbi:hypothetical protein [Caulobacter sp.]|uniref:hypothetical protein n=1 Tax=Caulobacter sp. TaxID=78 RepID=UPI0031E0C2BA